MKGEATRTTILEAALHLARVEGLDALSIGRLAKGVGLSKSGLFSHFRSKESLQVQVLERAAERFVERVVKPAMAKPRGEPRLRALFDNWLHWGNSERTPGGCVFLGAAAEYDDRPGKVRDFISQSQRDWLATLARSVRICQEEGHLRRDINPEQFAFSLYGAMMAYHLYSRLLGDTHADLLALRSFEDLLAASR